MSTLACRSCGARLEHTFADLGESPLANAFQRPGQPHEKRYPLHARVCAQCLLVQLPAVESPETLFRDYVYYSSYSDTWLRHAERFAAEAVARFGLGPRSLVLEVASNDGYLLQYFLARGVRVLGVEPAATVAAAATAKGIPTLVHYFGTASAREIVAAHGQADLLVANNVLAHVPGLNDFVAGLAAALKPSGTLVLEWPHVLNLIRENQFDTIYHEHFSYFSLLSVEPLFARHGLSVIDVEQLPTHGGSLRIFAVHAATGRARASVTEVRELERRRGLDRLDTYTAFGERPPRTREKLLEFLRTARAAAKHVAGYGAAAKGNTLLNYCGVDSALVAFVADRNPHKQGLLLPGSRIPVVAPEALRQARPDYVLVLPWNIADEITAKLAFVRDWGGRFVVPVPEPRVLT